MGDVAKRLVGPVALGTTGAVYYTVPTATTTIVRNIHVANASAASGGVALTVAIGTASAATAFYYQTLLPASGSLDWSGFLPLATGETLVALAASINSLTLTVSGVESS